MFQLNHVIQGNTVVVWAATLAVAAALAASLCLARYALMRYLSGLESWKDTQVDLFASLSIALDRPFEVGDFIVVDEFLGTVDYVGLKTTRVRSLSGEQIIFSNTDLLKSRIRNFKRMTDRRVLFSFGVARETPAEQLRQLPEAIRRIVEGCGRARFDRAHFKEFKETSLAFEVVYYIQGPDYNLYMDIQQDINLELHRLFTAQGIQPLSPRPVLCLQAEAV